MRQPLLSFYLITILISSAIICRAQDPNFSQFFSSPLTISPALTGNGETQWRAMANLRNQWIGFGSTYRTKSLSVDGKLMEGENDNSYLGLGGMVLMDDAMEGIYKSTHLSLNVAYHLTLDEDAVHGIAVGFGGVYSKTNIDFAKLSFGQQLSSTGFNRPLPSGEPAMNNMQGYASVCAGVMYTYETENTFANFGVAGYRFVKTKNSVYNDATQYESPRFNAHFDFGTLLNEQTNLSLNAIYLTQAKVSSITLGGTLGFSHGEADYSLKVLNLGMYYRLGDAIIPYVGYVYNSLQFGLSYDVTVSKIKSGSTTPKTFELSLIYRHSKTIRNKIPCPGR